MVNFIFTSTGLRDAKIAGKTLFLGISVRLFSEEISFGTVELSKVDSLPQCK